MRNKIEHVFIKDTELETDFSSVNPEVKGKITVQM